MAGFPLAAFAAILVATVVAVVVDSQFWWLPVLVLVLGVVLYVADRALRGREPESDRLSGRPPR